MRKHRVGLSEGQQLGGRGGEGVRGFDAVAALRLTGEKLRLCRVGRERFVGVQASFVKREVLSLHKRGCLEDVKTDVLGFPMPNLSFWKGSREMRGCFQERGSLCCPFPAQTLCQL